MVTSGCRISEATALTPGEVDTVKGTVRIIKAWKKIPGGVDAKYETRCTEEPEVEQDGVRPQSILDQLDCSHEYLFTTTTKGLPIRAYSWRTNVWMPSVG